MSRIHKIKKHNWLLESFKSGYHAFSRLNFRYMAIYKQIKN